MRSVATLEAVYRRLADVPADQHGFRVAPTIAGPDFLAAIDPAGGRHILARIGEASVVVPDARSAGIQVVRRELIDEGQSTWFIDVASGGSRFNDLFTIVADEILADWQAMPTGRLDLAAGAVIERWRGLFAREQIGRALTLDEAVGLIGELMTLRDLGGDVRLWAGPLGGRHDFVGPVTDIEVKSTRARAGYAVEIHSLEQLVPAPGTPLFLAFNRLEETPTGGESAAEIVDSLVMSGSDSFLLVDRIASISATPELLDPAPRRFRRLEHRAYRVDDSFPAITADDIRHWPRTGVTYLRYGLDLALTAGRLDSPAWSAVIQAMATAK